MGGSTMKRITTIAAALVAIPAGPVWAQVSGPISVNPETGQQTYDTSSGSHPWLTPEQQNWNSNNLDTTGTGTAFVGSLMHYTSRVSDFSVRTADTRSIYLRWTPPSQDADRVQTVDYKILPGRHTRSQPIRIVDNCPSTGYESKSMYHLVSTTNNTLDLSQSVTLEKCSRHRISGGRKSMVIRLTGTMEMTTDGGYAASFGPHDNPFNCGPPTWPSAAHQAAGHPPYSEWCDISVWWEVK